MLGTCLAAYYIYHTMKPSVVRNLTHVFNTLAPAKGSDLLLWAPMKRRREEDEAGRKERNERKERRRGRKRRHYRTVFDAYHQCLALAAIR